MSVTDDENRQLADFVDVLITQGLATPETIQPCTHAEVVEICNDQKIVKLPIQYRQFLLTMGRQAGNLLRGTDFFYPSILGLLSDGQEILRQEKAEHLFPSGAIVVGMHQGYQLYWLSPTGELSWYSEGDQHLRHTWPTLLDFLKNQAATQLKIENYTENS